MGKMKNSLAGIVLAASLGLSCKVMQNKDTSYDKEQEAEYQQSETLIYATVLDEKYYSGPESKYIIKARRNDNNKIIVINVIDSDSIKKEMRDMAIDQGTVIAFPQGNVYKKTYYKGSKIFLYPTLDKETYFTPSTDAGTKYANRIKIHKNAD
jgi:uncharacterized protein YpmB